MVGNLFIAFNSSLEVVLALKALSLTLLISLMGKEDFLPLDNPSKQDLKSTRDAKQLNGQLLLLLIDILKIVFE